MPSFSNDAPLELPPSPPALQDYPHRPSHEKSIMSNAFVYTNTNGVGDDVGRASSQFDGYENSLKNASLHSVPNGRGSGSSMTGRDRTNSRTGSPPSISDRTVRPSESRRNSSPPAASAKSRQSNGDRIVSGPAVNGGPIQPTRPRSPSKRSTNGDRMSEDQQTVTLSSITTGTSYNPSHQDPTNLANGEPLSTTLTSPPLNRYSSPPIIPASSNTTTGSSTGSLPHPERHRLTHRHTLQVPRLTPARGSRDFSLSNPNTSEDALGGGRFSPTVERSERTRRASLGLVRRTTRSIHSDLHIDEMPQDEDAARWTEAIRQKRASKRKRKEEEDDERVIVGTKVDQNHVNWVTAYNMLTGIRFTVSRTNAKMDRELTDADFVSAHKFSFDITGNELTPSAKYDFKFKDYSPWVFRHLRAKFKLDPADYLMSLTSKYILSELGSPGKSGSFFYFSRDYKYIIKTIHHAEHKLLRKVLKDYYQHIVQNPNTLLSQFYGLHRVKIAYGRKIHFVVMNNLFPPHRDIHQMFDLKGSTIGRDFKEEDLEKNPRATLKDLNFLRRNLHLEFGPNKKELFVRQMKRDVELLRKLKIMDYSLLVGVHDLSKGNEDKLRDKTLQVFQPGGERSDEGQPNMLMRTPSKLENMRKARELRQIIKREKPIPMEASMAKMPDEMLDEKNTIFYADDGGFRATHDNNQPGEEIYYLGIIDCLTHYGLIKKIEHAWKGLSNNRSQISAVPPENYGDRFVNFITAITMTKEEAVRHGSRAQGSSEYHSGMQQTSSDTQRTHPTGVVLPSMDTQRAREEREKPPRSPAERTLDKAEKQVAKVERHGGVESDRPDSRTLKTIRTPSAERTNGTHGATLPVVEEAGEAGSTGARSHRSDGSAEREKTDIGTELEVREDNGALDISEAEKELKRLDPVERTAGASPKDKELPPLPEESGSSDSKDTSKKNTQAVMNANAVLRTLTSSPDSLGAAEREEAHRTAEAKMRGNAGMSASYPG